MTASPTSCRVSAIVALNPHRHDLGCVLDGWAVQEAAGDHEVIVIHDGCRPGVDAEIAGHRARNPRSPVRLVDSADRGRAASNNTGIRASDGSLLLLVADDFVPDRGLVAAHRRFHALLDGPAVGIGPAYFPAAHRADPFCRWLEDTGALFGVAFGTAGVQWRDHLFYVGNASLLRTTFDRVGAFDERFLHDLFDDFEFGQRLRATGIATHFVPRAIAWHDHEVTLDERRIALRRLGEASARYEATGPGPWPWSDVTARSS
ncbi:MAG: glycosyltransferase, partial [Betaproteobacteria bacterium]